MSNRELVQQLNGALMNSEGRDFEIRADFVREIIAALSAPSEAAAIPHIDDNGDLHMPTKGATPRTDGVTRKTAKVIVWMVGKYPGLGDDVFVHEHDYNQAANENAGLRDRLAESKTIISGLSDLLRKEGEELATAVAHANGLTDLVRRLEAKLAEARKDAESKQAKIDSLMLEFCPKEMTDDQLENWMLHQSPVAEDVWSVNDAALAAGRKG